MKTRKIKLGSIFGITTTKNHYIIMSYEFINRQQEFSLSAIAPNEEKRKLLYHTSIPSRIVSIRTAHAQNGCYIKINKNLCFLIKDDLTVLSEPSSDTPCKPMSLMVSSQDWGIIACNHSNSGFNNAIRLLTNQHIITTPGRVLIINRHTKHIAGMDLEAFRFSGLAIAQDQQTFAVALNLQNIIIVDLPHEV